MEMDLLNIKKIAKSHKLKLLVLFGSHANGNNHKNSDLDLAFYSDKKVDEEKLFEELMSLLKRADIDLINLSKAHNHILRYEILSKGKLLYESEKGLKSRMESQSYFDYTDFKKYYDLRSKILDKKIGEMSV